MIDGTVNCVIKTFGAGCFAAERWDIWKRNRNTLSLVSLRMFRFRIMFGINYAAKEDK